MSTKEAATQEATDAQQPTIRDREHFAFSVPSEGIAVVENRRHDDADEHTYAVNVAQTGETSACSCPADEYHPGPANTDEPSRARLRSCSRRRPTGRPAHEHKRNDRRK